MKLNGNTYVKLDDVIKCLDSLTNEYEHRWTGAKFDLDQYYTSGEFPWDHDKIEKMKEKCVSRHAQSLACVAAKSAVMELD